MLPTRTLSEARSTCAYSVLLRAEIARFTRFGCPQRLVSVALILTLRWRGVTSCAVLCSPDVPPVLPFGNCTSGGLASFTAVIIACPHIHMPWGHDKHRTMRPIH